MRGKNIICLLIKLLIIVNSYSQCNVLWNYKGLSFFEKKSDYYIVETFYKKVEMRVDTLFKINDTLYLGKAGLIIERNHHPLFYFIDYTQLIELKSSSQQEINFRNQSKEYNYKHPPISTPKK